MRGRAALLLFICMLCLPACRHMAAEEALQLVPEPTPEQTAAPSPSPDPIPTLLKQAADSIARGEYKGAEAFYQQAIAWDSQAADAYLDYAACMLQQEETLLALTILESGIHALGGSGVSTSLPLREQWWRMLLGMRQEGGAKLGRREAASMAELAYIGAWRCVASTQEYIKGELLLAPYVYYTIPAAHGTRAYPPDGTAEIDGIAYTTQTPEKVLEFIEGAYGAALPDPQAEYMRSKDAAAPSQGVAPDFFCDGSAYQFAQGEYLRAAYYLQGYTYLGDDLYYAAFGQDWMSTPINRNAAGIVPDVLHLLLQRADSGWGFSIRAVVRHGEGTLLGEGWEQMPIDTQAENAASSYPSMRTPAQREADLPAYEAQLREAEGEQEEDG